MFDLLSTSKGTVRRRQSEHIAAYKNPWLVRNRDKRMLSTTRTIQRDQKLYDRQTQWLETDFDLPAKLPPLPPIDWVILDGKIPSHVAPESASWWSWVLRGSRTSA